MFKAFSDCGDINNGHSVSAQIMKTPGAHLVHSVDSVVRIGTTLKCIAVFLDYLMIWFMDFRNYHT